MSEQTERNERRWHIVVPPDVPPSMHAAYVREAIAEAEARQRAEEERLQARRENEEKNKSDLAKIAKEQEAEREKAEEEAAKQASKDIDLFLREQFFATPGAREIDFLAAKKTLRADYLKRLAIERALEKESALEEMKQQFLASGRYRGF